MKTAISIEDSLFEAGEKLAREREISRSELYATALRKYLREEEGRAVTQKLNDIYGPLGGEDPETAEFRREAVRRAVGRNEW